MTKKEPYRVSQVALSVFFAVLCAVYAIPLLTVFYNAFKTKDGIVRNFFALPHGETVAGFSNFVRGLQEIDMIKAAFYSLVITLLSVFLILLCTSMCAWYISRVNTKFCRILYFLFVFSMAVPFQMVMFTLSMVANESGLTTPYTIPIVYLGFGAGLSVFMFSGFVRSIPISIEEAATIDGCSPLQIFFRVVLPVMQPTY
ncbi:MAG: carbohydrate ABC transporter permease, partial [Clostridia bacterium]|nr:carbohydrate ABC transporter permease [Clostridia bacterium]